MTETDITLCLGNSLLQHGKQNNRIYLMKLAPEDEASMIDTLFQLAREKGYSKIFAKVPAHAVERFLQAGFDIEARVPGFFHGKEDGCFLAYYFDSARACESNAPLLLDVLESAQQAKPSPKPLILPSGFRFSVLGFEDAPCMATVYREVFESYPFPIFSADYLQETMRGDSVYFGLFYKDELAALSSCEMDLEAQNVEMTDFATREAYRSRSLATYLLHKMDAEMAMHGIKTAYTIARAGSHSMNITFARNHYAFAGRLKNNTAIGGAIESMNVWHKRL